MTRTGVGRFNYGLVGLAAVGVVVVAGWAVSTPVVELSFLARFSQLLAALGLAGLAGGSFIATRAGVVDRLFGGLDKAYVVHRWLAIVACGLVVAHFASIHLDWARTVGREEMGGAARLGVVSLILFGGLGAVAWFAKLATYERWQGVHRFMALPYVVGLVHYYGSSKFDGVGWSPFSLVMDVVNVVGVGSVVYGLVLYRIVAFRYRYEVSQVRTVAEGVTEITARAAGRGVPAVAGQFVFIRFPGVAWRFPPHPFTISGLADGEIQFTVKALGDHTARLAEMVRVGDALAVAGPHGRFDYRRGGDRQIWVAGGIGLTPFRSFYKSGVPGDYRIDLFYAYHGAGEAAYLDELAGLPGNIKVHLIDDTKDGFVSAQLIRERVDVSQVTDIYVCGPKPMRRAIEGPLVRATGARFHAEHFLFRRR